MGLLFQVNQKILESVKSDPKARLQLRRTINELTSLNGKPNADSRSNDKLKNSQQNNVK